MSGRRYKDIDPEDESYLDKALMDYRDYRLEYPNHGDSEDVLMALISLACLAIVANEWSKIPALDHGIKSLDEAMREYRR